MSSAASPTSPFLAAADVIVQLVMSASEFATIFTLARCCSRFNRLADSSLAFGNAAFPITKITLKNLTTGSFSPPLLRRVTQLSYHMLIDEELSQSSAHGVIADIPTLPNMW